VDLDDLRNLNPSEEEARRAIAWMRSREILTPANEAEMETVLKALGHESLL